MQSDKKIDYVIISSDDNKTYKDFYPIVAKKWFNLGFKTYYINITDNNEIYETKWGIIHNIKALKNISSGFQSQVVRLFSCNFIQGNLLMSDIDMLPLNRDYFNKYLNELDENNVIIYSGQPYKDNKFYPMCYILSHSSNLKKILEIEHLSFDEYCDLLIGKYGTAWNTDENFMFDKFQKHLDKIIIKTRDLKTRIDRFNWSYNNEMLKKGYYIDSHLLRPLDKYFNEINKLLIDAK